MHFSRMFAIFALVLLLLGSWRFSVSVHRRVIGAELPLDAKERITQGKLATEARKNSEDAALNVAYRIPEGSVRRSVLAKIKAAESSDDDIDAQVVTMASGECRLILYLGSYGTFAGETLFVFVGDKRLQPSRDQIIRHEVFLPCLTTGASARIEYMSRKGRKLTFAVAMP